MCKPQYYFCFLLQKAFCYRRLFVTEGFLLQKAFSSPRWRTQVRRAGEKMTYVQKTGKRKEKEKPRHYDGGFSWKEKMFCLAIFLSIFYITNQFVAILMKM